MIRVAFPKFDSQLKGSNLNGKPQGTSNTQLSQVNVCFTSVTPPTSFISPLMNDIRSIDTVKLPKLSFKASKFSSNENICGGSFRRNKQKTWQPTNGAPDPFVDYEYNDCGFESMRAYTNDQVFEKPSGDKNETIYVLLIKFVCKFLSYL